MKKIFKRILLALVVLLVLAGGYAVYLSDKFVVPIIMYHSVTDHPAQNYELNTVSPNAFRKQMQFLKDHHFDVISVDELVEGLKSHKKFSRRTAVITFDDGYEDNFTEAYPILSEFKYPATIFLIYNEVGQPGFVNWTQVKEMEQNRITFGSHTVDHSYLPKLTVEKQQYQIKESKKLLEKELGHHVDFFSFPIGGFNEGIKKTAQEAGYVAAFTTNRGYHRYNEDLYELKRVRLKDTNTSNLVLWSKFSGYANYFRSLKNPE